MDAHTSYDAAARPLTALLEAVPPAAFDAPSPCEGWSARDVVRHLVETQRDLLTGHGVDLGDAPDVDADPGRPGAPTPARARGARPTRRSRRSPTTASSARRRSAPRSSSSTSGTWWCTAGTSRRRPVSTPGLTDAELERLDRGADSFGDALYMDGICKGGVTAPADAPREVAVLARLGRAA